MKVNSSLFIVASLAGFVFMESSCQKDKEIQPINPVFFDASTPLENIAVPADSAYELKDPKSMDEVISVFTLPDGFSLKNNKKRKPYEGIDGPVKSVYDIQK